MITRNILIIEDDTGIQAVTKFSLEMDGHWQVTTANCGEEGLLKAKTINPNVILLDLILPDMGGLETIERLNDDNTSSNIPIILFTAKLLAGEIQEFNNNNVVGLIAKPFDCLTLSEQILNILKKKTNLVKNCRSLNYCLN
ncbi:MAG: response regulator [Cyanobacteria bacterium J06643_13]